MNATGIVILYVLLVLGSLLIVFVLPLWLIIRAVKGKQDKQPKNSITTGSAYNKMSYTAKNVFGEIVLINIIRILFVGACVCFFLPMFNTKITYFEISDYPTSHTLTGFDTIFGIKSSSVAGSPLALATFMFPVIAIMVTLLDFLYNRLHIAILITGITGIILTVVYLIAGLVTLNSKEELFDFTFVEVKSGLSWGCLLLLGVYALITALSIIYGKVAKTD